jgi:hypothetical protein
LEEVFAIKNGHLHGDGAKPLLEQPDMTKADQI